MIVIGLCGGSAAGKGTAAEMLREKGIPVLDTDALYHRMIAGPSPCTQEILSAFGCSIRNAHGGIDRSALSALVFAPGNEDKLLLLNRIAHSHILQECEKWEDIQRQNGVFAIAYDAPLLFESGLYKRCDITLGIVADDAVRIRRIMLRDGITETQARLRLAAQPPQEELKKRVDHCIENNSTAQALREEIDHFTEKLKQQAQ